MIGKHKVGDCVIRHVNVFDETSELLCGIVARGPYTILDSRFGWYPELYDVLWKSRPKLEKGYFHWGIQKAEG